MEFGQVQLPGTTAAQHSKSGGGAPHHRSTASKCNVQLRRNRHTVRECRRYGSTKPNGDVENVRCIRKSKRTLKPILVSVWNTNFTVECTCSAPLLGISSGGLPYCPLDDLTQIYRLLVLPNYASIMKLGAVRLSEAPINFYQAARRHIQETSRFHSYRCENLKSHML
jgi:hypothetical protein